MSKPTRNARVHEAWPDIAKGIGILLVVCGHVARGVAKAGLPIDRALFEVLDALIYAFHMPRFFCIWLSVLRFGRVARVYRAVAIAPGLAPVALRSVVDRPWRR